MSFSMPDYGVNYQSSDDLLAPLVLDAQEYARRFMLIQTSDPNYKHELTAAQLWAIKQDDTFYLLSAHPDVYDLLDTSDYIDVSTYKGVIVHTTGWAAPLNEDGDIDTAPSQHDLRRRVAIASCVTSKSIGSALSFSDDKELILDPGSATGSLAEHLLNYWEINSSMSSKVDDYAKEPF